MKNLLRISTMKPHLQVKFPKLNSSKESTEKALKFPTPLAHSETKVPPGSFRTVSDVRHRLLPVFS